MSSTNRSEARDFHKSDYYITPIDEIYKFLAFFNTLEPKTFSGYKRILDPCAGGDANHLMSYPTAIKNMFPLYLGIDTIDIREDSLARIKADYLTYDLKDNKPDIIITNPPFNTSQEIIEKAMQDIIYGGFVIMLQRLNFMGSKRRKLFWEENIPKYIFVHHERMGFTENGKTDSIEYAYYVWQKGYCENYSKLYII